MRDNMVLTRPTPACGEGVRVLACDPELFFFKVATWPRGDSLATTIPHATLPAGSRCSGRADWLDALDGRGVRTPF